MSVHQTNKDKPRSSKCRHFCFPFDTHNYCPTCRESGKGDDPCVTFKSLCQICASFTEEQMLKISQRKRYNKKQKCYAASSKDDKLDLLGDDVDSFTGSQADLESAADNLFTSPPCPQPLTFSSLSLKTPAKTVHAPQVSRAISDQDQPQHDPDPPYYREVALSDVPSQYAEEVDTFRRILSLPDPREFMPKPSISVMVLDDEKGCQKLRLRGPSSMLPLSSVIKDAFDKFEVEHDFSSFHCKVVQGGTALLQGENTGVEYRFCKKSVLLLNPLGLLWARFPYQFLRNWNTKLGKTYPLLTSLLPLPRLHLLAM